MRERIKLTVTPAVEKQNNDFIALIYSKSVDTTNNLSRAGMSNMGAYSSARIARIALQRQLPEYVAVLRGEYEEARVTVTIEPIYMGSSR